jgi:hypothetical protein
MYVYYCKLRKARCDWTVLWLGKHSVTVLIVFWILLKVTDYLPYCQSLLLTAVRLVLVIRITGGGLHDTNTALFQTSWCSGLYFYSECLHVGRNDTEKFFIAISFVVCRHALIRPEPLFFSLAHSATLTAKMSNLTSVLLSSSNEVIRVYPVYCMLQRPFLLHGPVCTQQSYSGFSLYRLKSASRCSERCCCHSQNTSIYAHSGI